MSVQAIDWALRLVKNVTPTQKLILICLANHAGPDGTCWPSQTVVADYSGLSRDAVNRNIKDLVSLGLISTERRSDHDGRETTKIYRLRMAEPLAVLPDDTGVAEMGGRCLAGRHLTNSTTSEEQKAASPESAGCLTGRHRCNGERQTGVLQDDTDCLTGRHKSLKEETSKEETKDLKTPPTPKTSPFPDEPSDSPISEAHENAQEAENEFAKGDGSQSRQSPGESRPGRDKKHSKEPIETPSWLNPKDWNDFLAFRESIRAPMNDIAQTRAITELEQLRTEGHDPSRVIGQSIVNGWKGLFPVKRSKDSQGTSQRPKTFDEIRRENNQKAVNSFLKKMGEPPMFEEGEKKNVIDAQ